MFTFSTTQQLNWVIRSASDVEQNIVSVERILQYVDIEPEAPQEIPETKPEPSWPKTGAIRFENYSMRYRKELERVLRSITIDIVRQMQLLGNHEYLRELWSRNRANGLVSAVAPALGNHPSFLGCSASMKLTREAY